jgi:uncharacterized membrane protein YqgA involved in biofilm formation
MLEAKFNNGGGDNQSSSRFIKGFLTASLVFCVGPMAILGSIQDGLTGDRAFWSSRLILDGFAALAFASSLALASILCGASVVYRAHYSFSRPNAGVCY